MRIAVSVRLLGRLKGCPSVQNAISDVRLVPVMVVVENAVLNLVKWLREFPAWIRHKLRELAEMGEEIYES